MSGIILEPIVEYNAEKYPGLNEPVEYTAPIEESVDLPGPPGVAEEPVDEGSIKRPRGRPKRAAKPKPKQEPKLKSVPKIPPPPELKRETTTRRVPQPAYS